jgi:RNA polymerase-binding transcription factor DksA
MTQHFDETAARSRLEADKDRVHGLITSLQSEGLDQEAAAQVGDISHVTDPADHASETFEREKDVSILEQLEEELAELQAALERIDNGTYGVDEVTGKPIAPERLEARPTARTNVDTEGQREADGRLPRGGAGDPEEY